MLLMKTDKVIIPLYGNSVLVAGKLVKEPEAIGHFQRERDFEANGKRTHALLS